ncbi:hypothetical protein SAMN05421665_0100 [Yoonia rosea]|uniref:Uncharacterized protein n=1 Tax=Yoonia rosea TaxID=287098 RepID=A0A1R3WBN8_9RHOB|nr:hypothetical protein [Yoonia rosea]SIT74744.1 hypothetical protein SAMN05421665_0100 [Yoonia rosea]
MTVKEINQAFESCLTSKSNYAALVYNLYELECSDKLIEAIVVGALGETVRSRIVPLLTMVRAYENLTSSEQIDMLYAIVDKQDTPAQDDTLDKRLTA